MNNKTIHILRCSIARRPLKRRSHATFASGHHRSIQPTPPRPPPQQTTRPPKNDHVFPNIERRNCSTVSTLRGFSSQRSETSTKEREPIVTDEGVILHQADPSDNDGQGLVWGSVLWPSGVSLSKYLYYRYSNDATITKNGDSCRPLRVLELGCGTGIVGLTLAKGLPPTVISRVSLTDSESALWSLLRKNIDCNVVPNAISTGGATSSSSSSLRHDQQKEKRVVIHGLDWRDPSTFLPARDFDLVVAADVLYSGMDKLFARALASHLARDHNEAFVACPFRKDSPLEGFFGACHRLGLNVERLEDKEGRATGAHFGMDAFQVFSSNEFVPLEESSNMEHVTASPSFAPENEQSVQIFRIYRSKGRPEDAIRIRRASRI
ncbi:unnamed protein product [Cylindrotheca closterium]|uniref:Calmodulin-lysine N-methyltransferase n=1 Tax=Cylindrotheca closterium TaxID=2856 RepID=A0AAD2FK88_9STRA|nr:unnamed protein product [Cylindrotheca closterium]